MAPKKETKITREEELLLEGFNKNVSTKSSALFYGNAFIVSAIPVWLYWRVHSIDITSYAVIFAIGTLVSTWLLAFAYKNTKHMLKHKVALKREAAVTKEMTNKLADDKKISKKEKDERILWKKNEVRPPSLMSQEFMEYASMPNSDIGLKVLSVLRYVACQRSRTCSENGSGLRNVTVQDLSQIISN